VAQKARKNVLIIGSGGRDFHNFNTYYRDNEDYNVVGFTAGTQIPGIIGRIYPPELAGSLYPKGIPVYSEADLSKIIPELKIDDCVFSYSDVPFQHVLTLGAICRQLARTTSCSAPATPRSRATSRSSRSARSAPAPARARPRGRSSSS
jgi:predicted GTPase